MDISFLIVTRNRPEELRVTLDALKLLVDPHKHEVLVFIDDCHQTMTVRNDYDWVQWSYSDERLSASPARNKLYKLAKGAVLIGLDDDAHPISPNFIDTVLLRFRESDTSGDEQLGIIAFQEVRGIFETAKEALDKAVDGKSYETNDFIGCGFAIRKVAYEATNGFPVWMDIYGEEPAVALEVMDAGYTILYDYDIRVNHRVDVEKRKRLGRNYFRFEHQLRNVLRYYMVYYPKPSRKIIKALAHNFNKYALSDWSYFKAYVRVVIGTIFSLKTILSYRKPVQEATIRKKNQLRDLKY